MKARGLGGRSILGINAVFGAGGGRDSVLAGGAEAAAERSLAMWARA